MALKASETAVPERSEVAAGLSDHDYAYACQLLLPSPVPASAERWARAVFEDGPALLRRIIVVGWLVGLRLRLRPRRSPDCVLGWPIISKTEDEVVLGVDSFLLTARLVVLTEEARVTHSTFVRYDRAPARVIWPVASIIHRRVVPYLLTNAERMLLRATNRS